MPVFSKIKDGTLDLTGYRLDSKVIKALSEYITDVIKYDKEKGIPEAKLPYIRHLILDSNDFKDIDLSNILEALGEHDKLQSIIYSNNEFLGRSCESLVKILSSRSSPLQSLHLRNVKTN